MQEEKQPVISIQKMSKRYAGSERYALKQLTLKVNKGEVYGFLGPNGAGKSTAIRTLMNYIQPTEGQATILGKDIVTESVAIKEHIGYLSGDFAIYPKMTGRQFLSYMHDLQPADKAYTRELTKRLKADLSKKMGELSRGNRQKIGIIQAFMHKPSVLILDEPTSGLDPLMQEVFYELVRESKNRGAAVFVSSHILSEVQKICDRIGIIREGKLVDEQDIAMLSKVASQTFDISFASDPPLAELKKIKGLSVGDISGNDITVRLHGKLAPLFAVLAKHDVSKLDARNLDLEEVFLGFYEDKGVKR